MFLARLIRLRDVDNVQKIFRHAGSIDLVGTGAQMDTITEMNSARNYITSQHTTAIILA